MNRQKMGAAALLMAFSVLLSRFMGLGRDKLISWQFGAGSEADVYFAAFVVPDFLNYLLAGGYLSITLIPLLSSCFEKNEADGWRFFGTIFCLATVAIGLLSALAWVFAPELAPLVAPGFDLAQQERLTTFLRIVLPAQVFFLPGACLSALLYIRRQFAVPALMPLIYNGFIMLGGVLLPLMGLANGMEGFCWGVLAGAAVGAFALPLLAVRAGDFQFIPRLWHPLLGRFLLLALPLMIGQSVVVLDEQFVRIFGSMAGDGAVSLLNYARRIMMVPVGVVAQAAGVASFPFLAALAAKNLTADFNHTLHTALKSSFIVVIPMVAWLVVSANPVLGFIFEGGSFDSQHTAAATPLLQLMLLAVPLWVLQQVMGRAFYARQDTVTPAVVGTLATVLAVPVYLVVVPVLGAAGVALTTTCSLLVYALWLTAVWCRRWGKDSLKGLMGVSLRSLLVVAPATAWSWACTVYGPALWAGWLPTWSLLWQQFLLLMTSGLGFLGLYLVSARFIAPEFLHILLGPLRRCLCRQRPASEPVASEPGE